MVLGVGKGGSGRFGARWAPASTSAAPAAAAGCGEDREKQDGAVGTSSGCVHCRFPPDCGVRTPTGCPPRERSEFLHPEEAVGSDPTVSAPLMWQVPRDSGRVGRFASLQRSRIRHSGRLEPLRGFGVGPGASRPVSPAGDSGPASSPSPGIDPPPTEGCCVRQVTRQWPPAGSLGLIVSVCPPSGTECELISRRSTFRPIFPLVRFRPCRRILPVLATCVECCSVGPNIHVNLARTRRRRYATHPPCVVLRVSLARRDVPGRCRFP